jgi:hypothetical protein
MFPENLKDIADPGVRERVAIERRIVTALIDRALAEGYELSVHDGEEWHLWTTDRAKVIDAIMNTDEDRLYLRKDGYTAWVLLVYGNSGWDVICDYNVSLEALLEPINALASGLEDAS